MPGPTPSTPQTTRTTGSDNTQAALSTLRRGAGRQAFQAREERVLRVRLLSRRHPLDSGRSANHS